VQEDTLEREREREREGRRITIFNAEADRERLLRIDFARRERTFALELVCFVHEGLV
jgi:hypothetical protein